MPEQLKQTDNSQTEIDRSEAETEADGKNIGQHEETMPEVKLEHQEALDGTTGNAESVKKRAKEKLEAEREKAPSEDFTESVIAYLIKRCEEDQGMAEDVLQENKTWNKCCSYISEQAIKQARKLLNGVKYSAVEDRVVYEWAEDYYHKDDKVEAQKKTDTNTGKTVKKKPEKKKEPDKKVSKTQVSEAGKEVKAIPKKETKDKEPKKIDAQKKKETVKKQDKPSMEGQMSLFDLL